MSADKEMETDQHPKIKADKVQNALENWVLEEIKNVDTRYFQLSKFFFSISAGSFAILPFFVDLGIAIQLRSLLAPLVLIGIAVFVSAIMSFPPFFEVSGNTNIAAQHRFHVCWQRVCSVCWLLSWMLGVGLLVLNIEAHGQVSPDPCDCEAAHAINK